MSRILVVDDDPQVFESIQSALAGEGHALECALDAARGLARLQQEPADLVIADLIMPGMNGVQFLKEMRRHHPELKCVILAEQGISAELLAAVREQVCDLLTKPFAPKDLQSAVRKALVACPVASVEVISARPEWVEMRVPCDLATVPALETLLEQVEGDLSPSTRESILAAFDEMIKNAMEYGCKLNPREQVEVSYVRFKRAILFRIKDPGDGFDPARLEHAAIGNPGSEPLRHVLVRQEKGMRGGGFGILLTKQLVDELVYNERHNELMFIKYLE